MYLVQAEHPTTPGNVLKLFHTREAADREAIALLHMIGDDFVRTYERDNGPHVRVLDWDEMKADSEALFDEVAAFVTDLDSEEPDNQSWFVDVRVLMASDAPQAPRPESNYFADYDALVTKNRADIRADMLAAIQNGPGRDHVQPLDPADLVVMTLVRNLANIVSTSEEFAPSRDDKAEVMDRMVKEAEQAIEAGQAWLDKARPIGRIADDVVRLAGIIVAGTDLHASLSEAMDQHIYDEHDEREPDCHYQAVLDAWTAALAGITVTTPAPPAAVYDVPEIAIIMEGGLVQNIVARNDAPVIAHVVDYDTEGGGETEIVEIPQGEGKTAGAFLQCYDGKLDRQATAAFWTALKQ